MVFKWLELAHEEAAWSNLAYDPSRVGGLNSLLVAWLGEAACLVDSWSTFGSLLDVTAVTRIFVQVHRHFIVESTALATSYVTGTGSLLASWKVA